MVHCSIVPVVRTLEWNNSTGGAASNEGPGFTFTDISLPSIATYTISRPSCRQCGCIPLSVEICRRSSHSGKRATYVSHRPDSLEPYATHLPSGEIAGSSSWKSD